MAEKVPFFTLFESFQAPRQLRLLLHDACAVSGVLDREARTLEVQIECGETLPQAAQDALQQMLAQQYDLRRVLLHFRGMSAQKGDSGMVWGKPFTGKVTPIRELNIKMGNAIVEGRVFKAECYETRRKGMWTLNFNITDEHGSVAVRKAMDEKEAKVLGGAVSDGMWLRIQGKVELTYDGRDIVLRPVNIMKAAHPGRQDNAPEKRVELHLHTQMSSMDALTDVGKVVKQAAAWGHPAIAITDHGTVQAFPKARDAAKGKIKVLYGVEGYYVNNLDDRIAVHGAQDQDFDDEIVCFDIETTGLKVTREAITEIGAVVLKNGKITETFQTFVNPGRRLTPEIIGLTGITDAMLADAPSLKEALTAFLQFVNGRVLAAHNAEFDISFIRAGCRKVGLEFEPTYIDSLILAQNLLPELHKYKLDIVAEHLDLPAFNHHRASDDAGMVGYMLVPFFEKMRRELGISRLQEINGEMEKLRPLGGGSRHPKHIIILAKNKLGLKHLYQLVSASNLKYFKRYPIIPKTELVTHREGLIIGSACEAGELFRAVADHKDWAELRRIASFYDYLEIQPICNNMFMLRNGTVQSEEELYGVEGYYVNNLDDRIAVHGAQDQDFDDEIVCFDIETTGLKVTREAITEIGAVVLKNGKITETFQTFVNPGRRLTPEIIGLTGITDAMLADAPSLKEALTAFLQFVNGRVLAAHNAEFDISFIRAGCRKVGLEFEPTYIDSLILAQNLLPELHKYKLDIVAEHLDLPAFNHHRASDDAGMVGYMLVPFFEKMRRELGISRLQEINGEMEKLRPLGGGSRHPKHIIILAKNKLGLKHLYQLVSASNLKYFKRYPIIPKTELVTHREGLIIGSACEAGELFRAVADHKDWAELRRIASFYDYLEIQPICNNMFMLRNGTVQSEEELRELNRTIVRLGRELGKPVCATGDVHFQEPEDEVYRHILLASKKFADADAPLPIYFKTTEEMLEEFAYLGQEEAHRVVIDDPRSIADRIEEIELLPPGRLFPPRLENSEQELHDKVWNKCHELYGDEPPQLVVDRLNVAMAAARTCRTRSARSAGQSTSRTDSTSPLRRSWATAAARCPIST